jgi:hypothetical protein
MPTILTRASTILVLFAALGPAFASPLDDDRSSAERLITAIQAVESPRYDASRSDEKAYVVWYIAEQHNAAMQRAVLIGELAELDRGHEQLLRLLPKRWQTLLDEDGRFDAVVA